MSSISSEKLIELMQSGELDFPAMKLKAIRLRTLRGEDVVRDIARVKEEIDDLFQESKEKESSDSVGEG